EAALFTPASRFVNELSFVSYRLMRQFWQIPRAICTSSAISRPQPVLPGGSGLVAPFWLSTARQLVCFAFLHFFVAGRPKCALKTFRSASTFGLLNASMMAMVFFPVTVVGRL